MPSTSLKRSSRAGLALRLGAAATLAATAVYTAYTIGLGPYEPSGVFDDWLYYAVLLLALGMCSARAALVPAERAQWLLISAAIATYAAGEFHWLAFQRSDPDPPYPSVADGLWLAFFPLAYAALVLHVRRHVRRFHRSIVLDGLIGALAVAALAAAFVIGPVLDGLGGSMTTVVTNIAYPLGDLLLLLFALGVFALSGWRPERAIVLIGLGFATLALADGVYLYQVAADTYIEGTLLDALWLVGIALIGTAACQAPAGAREMRLEGWPVLVAPLVFTSASIALIVIGNFSDVNAVALVLAVGALVFAFARTGLTFREIRELPETRRLAATDELTGLANRRSFYEALRAGIDARGNGSASLAVLMIDLDRFKELNDTLGHYVGDVLLKMIGPRLQNALRTGGVLARLGGDEFAVMLQDAKGAEAVAMRIMHSFDDPFVLDDVTVHIQASVGIALYPEHAADADGLLQRADVAMYEAKHEHGGFRFYARERDEHSRERLALLGELGEAIGRDELVVHYQPQNDLRSGEVIGVEALVRWQHPSRGLLQPADFVPIAEQTGLMRPLTMYVLDRALAQSARWRTAGYDLTLAVNVSATNLLDIEFPVQVGKLLQKWEVPADRLTLEITEAVLMTDPMRAREVVESLSATGVRIALDDFGTGYSSLAYLKELPVDELKIDRSFVMAMMREAGAAAIVRSVIDLSRSLNLRVVAEGVEDAETLVALGELGCNEFQGFFVSRPVPAQELEAWLAGRTGIEVRAA